MMRAVSKWDRRNQQRADRSEARRQRVPSRREVSARDGRRYAVGGQRRGVPDMDEYPMILPLLEGTLDLFFWLRYRIRYHGAWLVKVIALDGRGFEQGVVRRFVVGGQKEALDAISEVSALLASGGIDAVDTRAADLRWHAA